MEVKKKELYYRGIKVQDLKNLSQEDLLKIVDSRARRSIKRGLTYDQKKLMEKVEEALKIQASGKEPKMIKTHSRDMIIIPKMLGLRIGVHNGKTYEQVDVKPEMVGHYLGEFSITRKKVVHAKNAAAEAAAAAAAAAPAAAPPAATPAPKAAEKGGKK